MISPGLALDLVQEELDEVCFFGRGGDGDGVFGEDAAELGDL